MSDIVRLHAKVHGMVQGVSFRYYTLRQAQTLGVNGYVRNRWDGSVEVVAEGERDAMDKLLAWLHTGPGAAEVERVEIEWQKPRGDLRHFEVRL